MGNNNDKSIKSITTKNNFFIFMKKIFSFLLLGLLLSVGNAWAGDATMAAGTNGSTCTVNEKAGIKVGTSSKGGDMRITVPAGATSLSFYAAAWKGVSGLSLNISGATTVPTSVVLTADDGISNNSPFTLAGQESSFLYTISLQNISAQTTLTLTSSINKRFVVWGATYSSGTVQPTLAATPTAVDFGSVFQNESVDAKTVVVTYANLTGSVTFSGLSSPFNATGTIASTGDAITISANTATIGEYSQTLTIQSADDNISVDVAVTMNVLDPNAPGTVNNPYTVAQARSAIDAGGDLTNKYVSGIISQVDSYNSTYHSITYWISDDGTTTNQLQVYSGKGLNGADFSAKSDLQVNDEVTVTGTLKKFNTTYEFDLNNELVSFNRPAAAPVINAENVDIAYDATSGEIAYTISNPTEATLTAASSTPWISNINVTASKVTFATTANDGDFDRVGYITLSYTGADDKLITVTQAHYVIDYAVLPFVWEGGASASLLALEGVTAEGLGGDYGDSNAPYLVKLDGTGDYIQVKTDSQPAKVTIGVKMIGGANASSISVQESADGTIFSEVQLLAISGNQNSTHTLATTNNFAATTRFVKMVFTKGSNVGVGPISITKVSTDPSIELNPENIDVDGDEHDGTINVTYKNLTGVLAEVRFCDAEGETATYDWVDADINASNNVDYLIEANTGAARTAYMKVYAVGNEGEAYSSLIAITQAACPYATLPFVFDGGKANIETTFGLTQEGLGSDYGSSPKLKFDDTDDEVVLRINEDAGVLSFDIKGNSFSGGTFSVKVSADGSNYSDLDEYTNLSNKAATNMAYSLAEGVRYIKWIYTNKNNGNVALGNIKVRKPASSTVILGANGYSTYAVDYKFEVSGADVYKAEYDEQQNAIVLTQVNVIEAGEGVVLKGSAENASVMIIPSAAAASDFSDNDLVGVLAPTEAEANWYVLATNLDGDGLTKFHNCYAGIEIPANKAYIEIGAATAPSIRIIEAGNEATDIQNVEGAEKAVKFMENGKLYIQKNGVVYDAMGKTVR